MIHKTTRSILSVLLAVLLLVTSVPLTPAFADGGAVSLQSESGEGRALEKDDDGTYLIYTADDLKEFAAIVNGTDSISADSDADARLMNDIDLSSVCSEENGTWTPIGNSINQYSGNFDGNGKTISGLYIDSDTNYQGLFGYLSTDSDNIGTVQNLTVSGNVNGGWYVGGVVGYNNGGTVTGCTFSGSGSVSGDWYVGGVVGDNRGTVENCHNIGEVSGNRYVGGVVGSNNNGTVENCYNTGNISGRNQVGGVVGQNSGGVVGQNSGNVTNCYNTGGVKVTGNDGSVGGVVGSNDGDSVTNCYNTGKVTGSDNSSVGGVVGDNSGTVKNCYNTGNISGGISGGVVGWNSSSVTNCYNIGDVSGTSNYVGGVVGLNDGTNASVANCYFLQQNPVIPGIGNGSGGATSVTTLDELWENFENYPGWSLSENLGRPVLTSNHEDDGSEQHPYEIFTAAQLKTFRDIVNGPDGNPAAHAVLMENIDLNPNMKIDEDGKVTNGDELDQWTPIGSDSRPYTGTFNGDGHTISGLYIAGDDDDQGLFGYVSGTVQNLTVSGSVSGNDHVGGVVGDNRGSVEDCDFTGSVTGTVDYVGGVVGYNGGTVKNCYNTGNISGNTSGNTSGNSVGGIVGQNRGTVENCYNTGNISGDISIGFSGGVVGWNESGTVKNCYNTGNISGPDSGFFNAVGGVVGLNSSASVANCYYQTGKGAAVGIGGTTGDNSSQTAAKSLEDFHSGEVAYLLEKGVTDEKPVWGQDLTDKNSLPTLVALDKANAQKVYRLTFNWNMGDQQPDTVRYTNGSVTLPADNEIPTRTGYHISGWKDKNGKPVTAETTVEEDAVFTAEWTANTYTITVTAGSGGTVSGGGNVTHGDSVEVTATANQGYHFVNWTENGTEVSTSATYSFTATANRTLTANFAADAVEPDPEPMPEPEPEEPPYSGKYSYEISTDIGDNGAISVDRYATEGERVTITVTPDEAYKLDDLSVTANGKDVELTANGDGIYSFTMPSADVKITATFAEDPDWTPDEPEEPSTDVSDLFIDIAPDAWYKDAIQYAYDNGLMTGVSATEFAPEATTTRAMIVSILARLEGVESAQAAGFADVDDNEWYATAVNWAANVGVVNGYEDNTFQPNTAITREQLAAILMNYASYKGEDVSNRADLASYTDQPSTWAEEAMQWAVAEGLISGVTNDQLQPQSSATRAQVAAILQRFLCK